VAGAEPLPEVLEGSVIGEQRVALKPPSARQDVMADYQFVGLSLTGHPLGLIRKLLRARRARSARELSQMADGERVRAAGVVTVRQSPQTATGVTFVTLEDETGSVNVVVWRDLAERQRRELVDATVLAIDGRLQVADGVRHLVAHRLYDWSALSRELDSQSRDFH
jgi:error-prone DNA polymerase